MATLYDEKKAMAQGWLLANNDEHGLRIERYGEAPWRVRVKSDASALMRVRTLAVNGDQNAQGALDAIASVKPVTELLEAAGVPEESQQHITSIDITPPGLKTHEGQERVRIAQTDWENHTAEVANMIEHMIDGGQVVPYDDGASKEAWRELRTAIRRRIAKQDAFLKAVSGQ